MSLLGGINPTNFIAQAMLASATGGTSLLVSTALKGVMLSIGDQVLQQAGQQLGLPQPMIDMAQAALHTSAGDPGGAYQNIQQAAGGLGAAAGLSNFEAGQIEQQSFDVSKMLLDSIQERLEGGVDAEGNSAGGVRARAQGASQAGGQSFLVQLALAMGKAIDAKMEEQLEKAKDIDKAKSSSSGGKSEVTQMGAELQALSQEISILSNALNTVIKSIGESVTQLARKQ